MARQRRHVGYGLPLTLAIGLHLGLLVISVIRFPSADSEPPNQAIVQATLVRAETATDQAQQAQQQARAAAKAEQQRKETQAAEQAEAEAEAERQRRQEQEQAAQREQAREAAEQAEAEAERRAEQAAQQEAERQRQAEAEAEAERERQAEEEARKQREAEAEAERERQAEEEARKQREAEAEAERKRQAEEEARKQREAEAEAERKRQAEEEARQRAAEASQSSLDQAIAGESEAVANAQQAEEAANGFINLVRQAVEQAWAIPPNVSDGAAAEISVRLGPSGELFAASIGRSSGNSAFDRSALDAVETAAPFAELRELPASVQREYREFTLRFRPGDIR
ncbi:cell envelope integrity protein TolA [Halomonas borealis]|uniref:cell envelope integrity protein TolA n=1 Tax=Halomonas borealis TaxID=2508710 RepID=UPI00109F3643|nr:cell envelope integrity protein TolA [Halomonas borealis]